MTDINESVDMTTGVRTVVVDNGDGTGTRTTYDEHGNETSVEHLTDLPIPEPVSPEITLADVAAALRDPLANLTPSSASTTVRTAILNQRAALDALLAQLDGGTP
jgi:hypothetical protein